MKRRAVITSKADEVAAREAKENILEVGLALGPRLLARLCVSLDTCYISRCTEGARGSESPDTTLPRPPYL